MKNAQRFPFLETALLSEARNQRTREKQAFFPDKKTATQFSLELQTQFSCHRKIL